MMGPASAQLSEREGRPVRLIPYADYLALQRARALTERALWMYARLGFRFDDGS